MRPARRLPGVLLALLALAARGDEPPPCPIAEDAADQRRGNAGCLISHRGQLLVIEHRLGGRLGLPGGTAKPGEPAQCTAHRETWEETGLAVKVGRFRARLSTDFLVHECEPLSPITSDRPPPLPPISRGEVAGLQWVDVALVQPHVWRFPGQLREVRALMLEAPDSVSMVLGTTE